LDAHNSLFINLSTKGTYNKGHLMKNVKCPRVDENKRFLQMVRTIIMYNDGGG